MTNLLNESEKIRVQIKQIVSEIVKEDTKDCVRAYKGTVVSAPNGSTCQVQLNGDDAIMSIPYSSKVSSVTIGEVVWVAVLFGDFRNAVVWEKYNFQ